MADTKAVFDKMGETALKERELAALEGIAGSLKDMAADIRVVRVVLKQMNNKS